MKVEACLEMKCAWKHTLAWSLSYCLLMSVGVCLASCCDHA